MEIHWNLTLGKSQMASVTVAKLLQMPELLYQCLLDINNYRYFLAEGGRGGGKTHAFARIFLYLAEQRKLRVVCGRETQNSIAESVYSVFADIIRENGLNFEIMASKIICRNSGSVITFRGFREQGAFNIQGMEGVDLLWIDEAQALTKQTIDVLIPTIRKDTAKIFFSMNRHVVEDPAYNLFYQRDNCLHIKINYFDNPFCTQALKREAEECKARSEDDYKHIWLGEPLDKSEDAVFSRDELEELKNNKHPNIQGYGWRVAGFDIARFGDDKSACVAFQQMGALHWEECFSEQWGHKDLNYTTGRIMQTMAENKFDCSIIDEDGMGSGPLDAIVKGHRRNDVDGFRNLKLSYKEDEFYGNMRTRYCFKLKDMVAKGHLRFNNQQLIEELLTLRYTFDAYQRRILISKDVMKSKFKVKSPNLADAAIYAVSLIGKAKQEQDKQFYNIPRQCPDEDLFKIAGV